MELEVGAVASYSRTFMDSDVRAFAQVSGDAGAHHIEPDALGRVLVHGLLTATLPTKLGGDINFVASHMEFQFLRPVFSGDTIETVATIESVQEAAGRLLLRLAFRCTNQHGKEVLTGSSNGFVMHPEATVA